MNGNRSLNRLISYLPGCRSRAFFLLFFLIHLNSYGQDYHFKHFNAEGDLPQPFIYTIQQDSKGYLWIGTGDGLARFNGFDFDSFTTADSLADNFVTYSTVAGDYMWFGHMNGRITSFNGKKFQPFEVTGIQSPVTGMAATPDGTLWVSTHSDGLFSISKKKSLKHFPFKDPLIINCIGGIANNELLLGASNGLFHFKIKGNSKEINFIDGLSQINITSIKKSSAGSFLVVAEDEIYEVIAGESPQVSKISLEPYVVTGVQDVWRDQKDNLWICTFGNGIVRFTQTQQGYGNPVYFNKNNGFISDNNKFIFEDREGCLWVGHFGEGITQMTSRTFFTLPPGSNVSALWFNHQYRWLGTDSGLIKTDQVSSRTLLHYRDKGLPADKINTLYSPDGKELWIGTERHGVFLLDIMTDKVRKLFLVDDVLSNSINVITGKGEEVWIGTKKGLCNIRLKKDVVNWFSLNQGGLPHNYVNAVFVDGSNRVWVGTRSGVLSFIQNNRVNKINLNSGIGSFEISAIVEDADSRIWAGSLGKGVFIIDKTDSVANLTAKEGLFSDYCYSIVSEKSDIWISHKGGLSRITGRFSIKPVEQIDDNSLNFQFNANAVFKSLRQIWFGTDKGLLLYNPANESQIPASPILSIKSVKVNDELLKFTNEIVLPSGDYRIKIDYLGISLKQPEMVTYQYKLEGYEQWSGITKNTSVTYDHLLEGNYKFILTASDANGVVTQNPLVLQIKIKKPIRKHWWFYPSVFLFLVLIAIGYIKRRDYRFQEEKRKLEDKVNERTAEIQIQKTEIEQQRDSIREKNFQITASIKYARHIQNAILPQNDLIYGLFPNHFLLYKPKDIVSGDFFWIAEKGSKVIFTIADCTGHGVPGAFMSLLGITLLNEIVNIHGYLKPSSIVSRLRERIIESLQQSRSDSVMSDGMDMTLCVLDRKTHMLHFTGAKQDLLLIRNNIPEIIRADRFAVNVEYDTYREFTCQDIQLYHGDMIYLSTDGFKDQFGGKMDKKFMSRRFYHTLLNIHSLSMEQQKIELENRLLEWMGENEQTDDITVLGIKI